MNYAPRNRAFLAAHPEFESLFDGLTERVEYLAALWCMQYYAPLSMLKPYPFHLVAYEQLVRDGEETLSRLCDLWGIEMGPAARKHLQIASQTTKKDAARSTGKDPLARWKTLLSAEQADKILRVVEAFGLDFYTAALEPDYTRLAGFCPVSTPAGNAP